MNEPNGGFSEVPSSSIAAGAHGGEGPRLARALGVAAESVLDLSMSMNPVAPNVGSMLSAHLSAASFYPDAEAATVALAEALERPVSEVLLTNGGAEAIALVAGEVGVGRVDDPDFSLYRRHLASVVDTGPRWRSDPHSPSGALAGPDEVAAVWDEAFYPLATGRWTSGRDAILLGSLTKVFSCPGLRIGYIADGDTDRIERMARAQPRWSVNGLALSIIPELLANAPLREWTEAIAGLRESLGELLTSHGLVVEAGHGPWVLVHDAAGLRAHLAGHAIAVRDCSSFAMADTVRIGVTDADGMRRLSSALETLERSES